MITRFILENLAARVIPGKVPPYFLFGDTAVKEADSHKIIYNPQPTITEYKGYGFDRMSDGELADYIRTNALGIRMTMPVQIRADGSDWWTLPLEPHVTISGKNVIVKKQVSKGYIRGTIKERWAQDDYEISISGILMNFESDDYPAKDVQMLKNMCECAKLEVASPLFELFSIYRIVVESYSFPFTSGPVNQAYEISAVSDDIYRLLLKKEDLKQL